MAVVTVTVPPTSTWPAGRTEITVPGARCPSGTHTTLGCRPARRSCLSTGPPWLTRQGGVVDYDHPGGRDARHRRRWACRLSARRRAGRLGSQPSGQ
jgi:hypothetical protein